MLNSIDLFFLTTAFCISATGFFLQLQRWQIGLPACRLHGMNERLTSSLKRILFQTDVLREKVPGSFHLCVFYISMLEILLLVLFQFPIIFMKGPAVVTGIVLDFFGFFGFIGLIYFFIRRLIVKNRGFDNKREDFILLALLFFIFITGFTMEGMRLKIMQEEVTNNPFGALFSMLIPVSENTYPTLSLFVWRIHFFLVMGFIAYMPFSKAIHIFLIPLNYIFYNREPKGVYKTLDLENAETFGAAKITDFTWKDLFDLDTCVRCGRCQENCPATLTNKKLNPKKVIQDLRKILDVYKKNPEAPVVNDDITAEVVYACTTCRACQENCPAGIEHLDKLMELKRFLVLMEGDVTPEHQTLFKNLERQGNPWGMPPNQRAEWIKGLEVPSVAEIEKPAELDFLFWPGCAGAYDDRYVKVIKCVVALFKQAGYKFAVLGTEETCCGDPARKSGNEYAYDTMARQNIETINGYGIKNIVTSCPHCCNTIAKDYSQIGGAYAVKTHGEVLLDALRTGRLKAAKKLEQNIAYHDSCYLARYNNIYEQPRDVIRSLGGKVVEFERRGIKGFCCGGGGANMFLEEHAPRMNDTRVAQILEGREASSLNAIAVACPFCMTMLTDGTKTHNREDIAVKDIAELVYEALEKTT